MGPKFFVSTRSMLSHHYVPVTPQLSGLLPACVCDVAFVCLFDFVVVFDTLDLNKLLSNVKVTIVLLLLKSKNARTYR